VVELLFDVNRSRGTTLILVTHDRELAARADVQVMLRDGRVVERREAAAAATPALV
jgi:putative ABC transport system ATP-binding protein